MTPKPSADGSTEESKSENPSLTVATDEKNSLFHYAELDTLVTVVDALNIFDVLASGKLIRLLFIFIMLLVSPNLTSHKCVVESLADKENISGMVGNTGTDTPPDGCFSEEERAEAMKKAMATDINQLRKLLKSRDHDATGTKTELAKRLGECR